MASCPISCFQYHYSKMFIGRTLFQFITTSYLAHPPKIRYSPNIPKSKQGYVEDMVKEITNITPNGVHYIDEEGNPQFIAFATCLQNYIMRMEKLGFNITDEDIEFWQEAKYVGVRVSYREPPAIEFYTEPPIYFEFPTKDDLYKVAYMIKKAGWRTNDGD